MRPLKNQGMLSVYVGSQGLITWNQALESTTHDLSVLCMVNSKGKIKWFQHFFLPHPIIRLGITCLLVLNKLDN